MLHIQNLSVHHQENNILKNLSIDIQKGEVHLLLGPNGAGKSTLLHTIQGNPQYTVSSGKLEFQGEDILALSPDKRANLGIMMAFQNPVEIPGLSLEEFLREAYAQKHQSEKRIDVLVFRNMLLEACTLLGMDASFIERQVNVGFSGGEKKRAEMLQLLILEPKLVLFDEVDSGLDVDAARFVIESMKQLKKTDTAFLIVSHDKKIFQEIDIDKAHVMVQGKIFASGDKSFAEEILSKGFQEYTKK